MPKYSHDASQGDATHPTFELKIAYQMRGDRYYENFDIHNSIPLTIVVEISFGDVMCETREVTLPSTRYTLAMCTLEDIIAEKLRALLQQIVRNRNRCQDVYDIAYYYGKSSVKLDYEKIARFFIEKGAVRIEEQNLHVAKSAFNDEVREKARQGYESLQIPVADRIEFDKAWEDVLAVVDKLDIPE